MQNNNLCINGLIFNVFVSVLHFSSYVYFMRKYYDGEKTNPYTLKDLHVLSPTEYKKVAAAADE
jgi:hypothetical protein